MNKFLYSINYDRHFDDLCHLETKYLFNQELKARYLYSELDLDIDLSIFIKEKIEILYSGDTFFDLLKNVHDANFMIDGFKIVVMDITNHKLDYQLKLPYMIAMSYAINGEGDIANPTTLLAITKTDDAWHLGYYHKNKQTYKKQHDKPNSYSNSLPTDLVRSLINLATFGNRDKTLVDPCCGAGTLVIDARMLGYEITGCELNYQVYHKARENLAAMALDDRLINDNMLNLSGHYDAAIIDIPYGLLSDITEEQQQAIISHSYNLTNRLVLVTGVDMSAMVEQAQFKIIDQVDVGKNTNSSFKRIVYICEAIR